MENHLHTLQVMMNEIRNQRVRKNEKIAKSFSFSLLIVVYHVIMMMQKEREREQRQRERVFIIIIIIMHYIDCPISNSSS